MARHRSLVMGASVLITITALTGCGTTGGAQSSGGDQDVSVDVASDLTGKTICFGFSGPERRHEA